MATATTQAIIDRACNELGLPTSSLTTGLITQLGTQSLSLLNSLGEDLVRAHDWQFLEATATFVGDGVTSEFTLPTDFGRVVNQTVWSSNNKLPMEGPLTAQSWGWVQFGIVSVGVFYRYRILHNKLAVFPTPAVGDEIKFYYIKKNWVLDGDGVTYKDSTDGNGDTPLFDRSVLIKGLKVRLWGQKGFDTTLLTDEYNDVLDAEMAQNQAAQAIRLAGSSDSILIDPRRNVPDGGW